MHKDKYSDRKFIIYGFFIFVGFLFIIRLLYLQVLDNEYAYAADNNARRDVTVYPPRGLIYDRNGELMVYNEAVFDLMVVPGQVKDIDEEMLCQLLEIDHEDYQKRFKKAKKFSSRKASIFEKQLSKTQTAYLQEKLYQFPGFYVQARTLRKYPSASAAHLLGYIAEVNDKELSSDSFYASGDYIGKSGIEKSYEKNLRGQKGIKKLLVDVYNREKGAFHEGQYDVAAINGEKLYTGIDLEMQMYGELLMQNKIGAIVAIEPQTGEILAMISSPSYDPNKLVGRVRSANYSTLLADTLKPLINRSLTSSYPPGSTFKLAQALIGQQEKVLNNNTIYTCNGGFHYGGLTVGCHPHNPNLNLQESIMISCNAYYCNVYRSVIENPIYRNSEAGYRKWREYITKLGFGVKYGIDLPYETTGNIPKPEYYDKYYGKGHWNSITTISLAIGQGEILATPLQLANLAALIANRGYYITPHLVAQVGDSTIRNALYTKKNQSGIDPRYFEVVINGMEDVVMKGTARSAFIDSISVCGKTGTAQNPHGENHSVFIAFAPKENPKIAIAVFIENSGYGGTWAAPIASLLIEKYLKGYINSARLPIEKRMLEGNLINYHAR